MHFLWAMRKSLPRPGDRLWRRRDQTGQYELQPVRGLCGRLPKRGGPVPNQRNIFYCPYIHPADVVSLCNVDIRYDVWWKYLSQYPGENLWVSRLNT